MKLILKALGAVALVALAATAAAPPTRPAKEADQLDYVFFASDQPVLIRVHLRVGDRPYDAAWTDWMDRVFVWFDKNKDGFLDEAEAGRLPQANTLYSQVQGGIVGGGQAVKLANLDQNKDKKASKDEFRAYFKNGGLRPLQFFFQNQQAQIARQVNDSIYRRLDKDGDGRLSRQELARLSELLRSLDENEDEMLTAQEVNTDGNRNAAVYDAPRRMRGQPGLPAEPGLLEIPNEKAVAGLASQMITKYDANKDGKLAIKEFRIDGALFNQLDRNHDGQLDATEVATWFQREPDLTFRVRVGILGPVSGFLSKIGLGKSVTPDRVEVFNPKKRAMPLSKGVKRVNGETLRFALGDTQFQFQGTQGQNVNYNGAKQFYLQQFDAIANKNGVVTKEQGKENRQNPYIFTLFAQADKNADDKLTKSELTEWLDLVASGANAYVSLQVNDLGRGVFEVMDTNGDTRLSIRETRTTWERIKTFCKDDRGLAVSDLPRTIRILAGQGNTFSRPLPPLFSNSMQPVAAVSPGTAPLWFRKMDRNSDSDVSPKEWLGTEEDFRAIDADGDGLLSVEEARQFEAKRKGGQPTAPAAKPAPKPEPQKTAAK